VASLLLLAEASAMTELLWALVTVLPALPVMTGVFSFAATPCVAVAFPPMADWVAELSWLPVWVWLLSKATAVPPMARTSAGMAVRAKAPRRIFRVDMWCSCYLRSRTDGDRWWVR